jgi:5-formyltetrahydrofolate cyclo-ligase
VSSESRKREWRARLLAARAQLPAEAVAAAAAELTRLVAERLAGAARVAAYAPVGREPGSILLLDLLRSRGTEVLLPVVVADGLAWGRYDGTLVPGPLGTRSPGGPRVGLGAVDAVLVPALAVDRQGVRLGRGGGYYDRALAAVGPGTPLVALLHDGELVESLPADPWDRSVTAAVSAGVGWTELPVVEHHGLAVNP